jgi:membrane protease YdiL (CAAX protease family)
MTDRHKTGWILGAASVTMLTPLAMVLAGRRIAVFEHLGFESGSLASPLWWILAVIVAGVYVIYTMRAIPLVADMQREISWFKLLGIASAVVGGIVEEAIFRRWVMDMLVSRGFPSMTQVAVSAVVFGLAHGLWALVGRDSRSALLAIVSTSLLGFALAIIYLAAGRNLGPCILAHVMINVVIEPWLMLSAVSGRWGRVAGGGS